MQDGPLSALAEQHLDALLSSAVADPDNGPGAALLVARRDVPVYRRALGLANVELGAKLAAEAMFRIGSVTKVFSAVALLQLCDQGKASLTDSLSKYVPHLPNSAIITLAQLLNHTSGIKGYNLVPGYMGNPCRCDLTTAQLLDSFMDLTPDFPPGDNCAYSNSGFVLVGAVLEAIGGKPWHHVVHDMLLGVSEPLRTSFGANSRVVPGMAEGYSVDVDQQLTRAPYISMTQPHAAGSLVSCLDDLLAFSHALHCGRLLQPATYASMCTPCGASTEFGFGMKKFSIQGQEALGHDGQIPGFASMMLYVPAHGLTVVLLCNTDKPPVDINALARRIAACVMGAPYADAPAVHIAVEALRGWSGRYAQVSRERQGHEVELVLVNDHLSVGDKRLRHVGGGAFVMQGSLLRIEFIEGSSPLQLRLFASGDGPGVLWQRVAA